MCFGSYLAGRLSVGAPFLPSFLHHGPIFLPCHEAFIHKQMARNIVNAPLAGKVVPKAPELIVPLARRKYCMRANLRVQRTRQETLLLVCGSRCCDLSSQDRGNRADLFDFPTILFHETGYSLHTLRQASRRSWRIGQRRAVESSSSPIR